MPTFDLVDLQSLKPIEVIDIVDDKKELTFRHLQYYCDLKDNNRNV